MDIFGEEETVGITPKVFQEVEKPVAEVRRVSMESVDPLDEGQKSLKELAGDPNEKRTSRCMETPFVVCVLLFAVWCADAMALLFVLLGS